MKNMSNMNEQGTFCQTRSAYQQCYDQTQFSTGQRNVIDMQTNQQSNGFNGQSSATNANIGQSNNELVDMIKQVNNKVIAVSSRLVDRIKFGNIAEN